MKLKHLLFTAVMVATTATAPAAVIANFLQTDASSGNTPIPAHDWVDGISNVSSIKGYGAITKVTTSINPLFVGWKGTINSSDYAGFQMTAELGKSINLTYITASANNQLYMSSATLGYRVDADGAGPQSYGDWVFCTPHTLADPSFTSAQNDSKVWNMNVSSGSGGRIEIGFFVTTAYPDYPGIGDAYFFVRELQVNGTVTAVPEPSAILLGGLGALTLFRRRRG